ncbi:hypothetical protein MK549_10680 [Streptococcus gallolyticus subsp. gallolyticus]|uniref:hypothetical protein n=1 Tax=Streptococcus gallolyticus TaxID=315405 RepID=UPI002284D081|nr:hypothetical protein [Streptococcus gallolyticus]MCY7203214.1 hypothetical protein [Streptococcus gallolyticus subsp. gallolyticus]
MEREDKIREYLNKKLIGKFKILKHQSLNSHYVGFSKYYDIDVFIKVFPSKQREKFISEKGIVSKDKQRYIDSFEAFSSHFLVLQDYNYKDIQSYQLDYPENLISIAQIIKKFHFQINRENTKISQPEESLTEKIEKRIVEIKDSPYINDVKIVWKKMKFLEQRINDEYVEGKNNTIIHGDFSLRNIKILDDEFQLIDFERSKIDFYFLDFIKFFYIDLNNDEKKIKTFLSEYYKELKLNKISNELMYFLIFYTSLGIFKYNLHIEDTNFLNYTFIMLEDVNNFFAKQR